MFKCEEVHLLVEVAAYQSDEDVGKKDEAHNDEVDEEQCGENGLGCLHYGYDSEVAS